MLVEIFPDIDVDIQINHQLQTAHIVIKNKRLKTARDLGRRSLAEAFMLFSNLLKTKREAAARREQLEKGRWATLNALFFFSAKGCWQKWGVYGVMLVVRQIWCNAVWLTLAIWRRISRGRETLTGQTWQSLSSYGVVTNMDKEKPPYHAQWLAVFPQSKQSIKRQTDHTRFNKALSSTKYTAIGILYDDSGAMVGNLEWFRNVLVKLRPLCPTTPHSALKVTVHLTLPQQIGLILFPTLLKVFISLLTRQYRPIFTRGVRIFRYSRTRWPRPTQIRQIRPVLKHLAHPQKVDILHIPTHCIQSNPKLRLLFRIKRRIH